MKNLVSPQTTTIEPVQRGTSAMSFRAISFRLSVRHRLWWAIGSPLRFAGFVSFCTFLCWLSYTSIGLSAVVVILSMAIVGHWVPYALSGRNRLSASPAGLHDAVRFRKRIFAWDDIVRMHISSPAPYVHGIVVDVLDRQTGDVFGEFLRSSWRPSRRDVQALFDSLRDAGWPPSAVTAQQHTPPSPSLQHATAPLQPSTPKTNANPKARLDDLFRSPADRRAHKRSGEETGLDDRTVPDRRREPRETYDRRSDPTPGTPADDEQQWAPPLPE
jgi:hypothetical protein